MSETANCFHLFKNTAGQPFKSGEVIFREGDAGEHMYCVKSGRVSLVHGNTVLETLEPGAIFGEMALLDQEKRSASALAAEDCEVVPIDQKRFRFLVQQTPFFAQQVMMVMSQRLRRLTKQLDR